MSRLSDTDAIVSVGINPPRCKPAPFGGDAGHERGADNVTPQVRGKQFVRETNVGCERPGEGLP